MKKFSKQNAIFAAILLAISIPRLLWLGDMEFKADEADIAKLITNIFNEPFSPLASVSYHSGIAHSSGFFYFLNLISLGSENPKCIVLAIALFNALALAIPLWFLRHDRKYVLTIGLCATSMALTLHSRKIWTPDLMAAWNFLCIGLYGIAHTKNKPALLAVSAFCAVMSGHMYLPGAISAGVITGILAIWFLLRNRAQALPWIIGSALGWLTFVPWLIATMNAENYGHAAKHMSFDQLKTALAWAATVPSPFNIYATYLRPVLNWMLQHSTSTWFYILLAFVAIGTLVSLLVYWYGLMRAAWKVRELAKDPLALASALLLLIMPLAIFLSGLGSYLHYWLATLPFVYHLIAWTANSGLLRRAAVVSCIISFLGAISFAIVVHERGGLAGEYGTSYNKQIEKTR